MAKARAAGKTAGDNGSARYAELVERFRRTVSRAVPNDATVLVISKGDRSLVDLEGIQGWHFPQRADGVYAGYYPADDATAIDHLEALRQKGADFLAIPSACLWWLDHYTGFARHLEEHYPPVVEDEEAGAVFALSPLGARPHPPGADLAERVAPTELVGGQPSLTDLVDEEMLENLHVLIDEDFYREQAGTAFRSPGGALAHYLSRGYLEGLDPHPLFDTKWYLEHEPRARAAGANPLVHFLHHSVQEGQDPNPYFDTEFYYSQGGLRVAGVNALVHYLSHATEDRAYRPNPLFGGGYYLRAYPDVKAAGWTPLAHYLRFGAKEGRYVSHVHENMVRSLRGAVKGGLTRGNWRHGSVLLFGGDGGPGTPDLVGVAEALLREHRVDPLLILHRRGDLSDQFDGAVKLLVLEDYAMASEVFRPSALRLLSKTLAETRPLFAISEVAEPLEVLAESGVGTYYLPNVGPQLESEALRRACENAARVLVSSPEAFHAIARALGHYPARVARRAEALPAVLQTATRDFGLDRRLLQPRRTVKDEPTRKVLIPCSDWNVSGVNASLEALGQELSKLEWNVEIVFTRDQATVLESAGGEEHLPRLPHRFLERDRPGVDAMWEALIADLELNAPCIAFLGYDFLANSIAPALSEKVGVVSWVQADDGDYYEQAYRLGRYCNRVVCVSRHISEHVSSLNPVVGKRTCVIHNSSVWRHDIARRRGRRSHRLRIVYAGRLVQYQKRILDYVELAKGLDITGVPYEVTLIGSFSAREGAQEVFEQRAADHIADGRIKLWGRMSRERILEQLAQDDFYVLLSDFEGMPLALIEAMAQGCVPVVGPISSGVPELIADGYNGVIVDHRDYSAWAKLVVELHRDRQGLSRMSRHARRTVRERFTIERVGRQFHDLFAEVAGEVSTGAYERPPALTWGHERSPTGDVLPPPSLHRPAALRLRGLS